MENFKVITNAPIFYSSAAGSPPPPPSQTPQPKPTFDYTKLLQVGKDIYKKAEDSGVLDAAKQYGKDQYQQFKDKKAGVGTSGSGATTVVIGGKEEAPKAPMSTGVKIGIAVGVIAVVGVIIYFVKKNN